MDGSVGTFAMTPDDPMNATSGRQPEAESRSAPTRLIDRPSLPPGNESEWAPTAFLYRPARNAMQSGPRRTSWILQLEPQRPLGLEPLMGWTSGDDPARHVRIPFRTRAAALEFAEKQGWRVYVLPENERKPVIKRYGDNFAFAKRSQGQSASHLLSAAKGESCKEDHVGSLAAAVDPLDAALETTFPASDPLPLWAGRIGPPDRDLGETA